MWCAKKKKSLGVDGESRRHTKDSGTEIGERATFADNDSLFSFSISASPIYAQQVIPNLHSVISAMIEK